MSESADRARSTQCATQTRDSQKRAFDLWRARGVWLGSTAFAVSLAGTELLRDQRLRVCAVVLLTSAGLLGLMAWGHQAWQVAFATELPSPVSLRRKRLSLLVTIVSVLLLAFSHTAFLAAPRAVFGLAGCLWLLAIAAVIAAALLSSPGNLPANVFRVSRPIARTSLEVAMVAAIMVMAFALRLVDLKDVPFNIYPDEVMTGTVAERAYINGPGLAPSLFSTLWSDIEHPALWFALVAGVLKLVGVTLASVRLPAAVFGAATVLPFYALVRSVWGRTTAIAGASIIAFSAANVHYSRMGLSNITTPFFWVVCFFFLLRGLRSGRSLDWALAGLAGGLSEHFYYGTRLLALVLILFGIFLLVFHWPTFKRSLPQFGWLVLGYLIGFGPLLSYFIRHPGLYYGRGASLLTWNHVPANWHDLQHMCKTLWPILSTNLLGISNQSAQDIMYYAPLLFMPEAALLVLGFALLVWHWRHPAAFLMLLSGLGVLVVGGTLVLYPNSAPPMLAHWTPAFPAFYAAVALPIGAWAACTELWVPTRERWIRMAVVVVGLASLACANIHFYFYKYYANPESLRSERYKAAQRLYEEQTVQSRYMGSLGNAYRVVVVGQSPFPYDPDITRYLVPDQEYIARYDPTTQPSFVLVDGKGLAFLFFPNSEQFQQIVRERYAGGDRSGGAQSVGSTPVLHVCRTARSRK